VLQEEAQQTVTESQGPVFGRPSRARTRTHEHWVREEAERMAARRAKAAERRKARHAGYWDDETVEPPKPESSRRCSQPDCGRPHKARGLCEAHYKAARRRSGRSN
jgi:hypothetical protein